jgi:hypothetical protein
LTQPELGTKSKVPKGLKLIRSVNYAQPVHVLTAQRDKDLVALLLDDKGVVTDSIELSGAASDYQLVPGCTVADEDVHLSLVLRNCKGIGVAALGWNAHASRLEAVSGQISCLCDPDL